MSLLTNALLKKLAASMVALAVFTVPVTGYAIEGVETKQARSDGHHKGKNLNRMLHKLGLSDQQKQDIKDIKEKAKADTEALRLSAKEFKQQAKELQDKQTFDDGAFSSLYAQYQDTFAQLALSKAKTKHAIFQVLTTEQRKKLEKRMSKMKKKHKRRKAAH